MWRGGGICFYIPPPLEIRGICFYIPQIWKIYHRFEKYTTDLENIPQICMDDF